MDMIVKIILVVIIGTIVVLSVGLSFVVTNSYRRKSKTEKLDHLNSLYEPDQIKLLENEMQIVYHAAASNEKLRSEYLRLDAMNGRMKAMSKIIGPELFGLQASKKTMNYYEFKKKAALLLHKIEAFNKVTVEFKSYISVVTAQFDFLRTEFASYQKILRDILSLYKKKRIVLSAMSKVIDEKANSMKVIEKRFFDATKTSQSKNAVNILSVYVENITLLVEAIDMLPSLTVHIEVDIPKNIKTLDKLYNGIKKDLGISFEHISYAKWIKTISEQYKEAKSLMHELKVKEATTLVTTIYKSVKFIENMINIEVRAKNLYLMNFDTSIQEVNDAMSDFVNLRDKLEREISEGKKFDQLLINNFTDLKESADILFALIKEHSQVSLNREMPFSTKVSKLKLLLNKTAVFINETNVLTNMLWEIEAEKKKTRNKLMQIKDAVNKVLAEASEKDIVLPEESKSISQQINNDIDQQFDIIKAEETRVDSQKISALVKRAVEFYDVVCGDILVAEMAANMIEQVSSSRALDSNLNATMSAVTRYYDKGDYDGALTHIINFFSERSR